MSLTPEDLASIDGIVSQHTAVITKLVTEHEITIYGPARQNGMRSDLKKLQGRMDKNDQRWYKLVGLAVGLSLAFNYVKQKLWGV